MGRFIAKANDEFYSWGERHWNLVEIAMNHAADRGNVILFLREPERIGTWRLIGNRRMATAAILAQAGTSSYWIHGRSLFLWGHPELLDQNEEADDHPLPEIEPFYP